MERPNPKCLAAGHRNGKPVYHRSVLMGLKPKPFDPKRSNPNLPVDPNRDGVTGARRDEWEKRMAVWEEAMAEAEPD